MGERGKEGELHPAHPTLRASLTVLSIFLISLAHYSTDTQHHLYHDVYRRLYYLPIFMGALWFGLKGGLGASLLCSVLYAPHVLFQWKDLPSLELEKYLEILLFNIVGATIGEWVGASRGLGYLMLQSNALLRVDLVFAAILWLSLMGVSMWVFVGFLEKRVITWKH